MKIQKNFLSEYRLSKAFNKDKAEEMIKVDGTLYYQVTTSELDPKAKYTIRTLSNSKEIDGEEITEIFTLYN